MSNKISSIDYLTIILNLLTSVPNWIYKLFGILVFILIILTIFPKQVKISYLWAKESVRNIFYMIMRRLKKKVEEKRLQTSINWKKNSLKYKGDYASKKVIIRNIYDKKKEQHYIKQLKNSFALVIKTELGENKSDNLIRTVMQFVTYDYLESIRKYLSPELTTALINDRIYEVLESMKAYECAEIFFSSRIKNKRIIEIEKYIDELKEEDLFHSLYLPYLKSLRKKRHRQKDKIKREAEKLLVWMKNHKTRLETVSNFEYFPNVSFVYVRLPGIPLEKHIKRAVGKFENEKCDIVVIGGWKEDKDSLNYVSKILHKKKYYHTIKLEGHKKHPLKRIIKSRLNNIHAKNKQIHYEIF